MMKLSRSLVAALAFASVGVIGIASAGAASMSNIGSAAPAVAATSTNLFLPVENVQFRGRGFRGGGFYRGGGYRGGGFRRGYGPGLGIITGLAIGGALAAPYYYDDPYYYRRRYYPARTYPGRGSVAYCMERFRSYDPRSGTYLGYDGYRHPCP